MVPSKTIRTLLELWIIQKEYMFWFSAFANQSLITLLFIFCQINWDWTRKVLNTSKFSKMDVGECHPEPRTRIKNSFYLCFLSLNVLDWIQNLCTIPSCCARTFFLYSFLIWYFDWISNNHFNLIVIISKLLRGLKTRATNITRLNKLELFDSRRISPVDISVI